MKRLQTLALAGIVAISACTTSQHTTRESEQSPSEILYRLEAGTDSMYARISPHQDLTRTLPDKDHLSYDDVDQDVIDAFTNRYYGLDASSRAYYLEEDVLRANQAVKELKNKRSDFSASKRHYERRIDALEDQVDWLRTQLKEKPEVVYQTRIVERTATKNHAHPVKQDAPFIRLGEQYYQLPFARIVCPGLDAPRRACIDLEDVRSDYRQHLLSQQDEWVNPVRINEQ